MEAEELYNRLLDLVERSEVRIDKTNNMIASLAETCKMNIEVYDRHLVSLEKSRDVTQGNSTLLLKNYNIMLEEVRELRHELLAAKEKYDKLQEAYIRLSEASHKGHSTSKSDVNISL